MIRIHETIYTEDNKLTHLISSSHRFLDNESSDEENDNEDNPINLDDIEFTKNEIINKCNFTEDMFIPPICFEETTTVEDNFDDASTNVPNESPRQHSGNNTTPSHFETFLDLLRGAAEDILLITMTIRNKPTLPKIGSVLQSKV